MESFKELLSSSHHYIKLISILYWLLSYYQMKTKKPTSDLKDLISSYAYRIFRMIVSQDRTISSVFIFPKILSDSNYRMPVKILQDSDITKRLQLNCMINTDLICFYVGIYDLTVSFSINEIILQMLSSEIFFEWTVLPYIQAVRRILTVVF